MDSDLQYFEGTSCNTQCGCSFWQFRILTVTHRAAGRTRSARRTVPSQPELHQLCTVRPTPERTCKPTNHSFFFKEMLQTCQSFDTKFCILRKLFETHEISNSGRRTFHILSSTKIQNVYRTFLITCFYVSTFLARKSCLTRVTIKQVKRTFV